VEKRIKLLPYIAIDGIPTFPDSEIVDLYKRMAADGTAATVFSDGEITSGEDFLNATKHRENRLYVAFMDGEKSGVAWLNRFEARFARMHWCLFSNQWGKNSVEIGKEVIHTIINMKDGEGNYLYDMMLGIVPSNNKMAVRYCEKCGGVIQGSLPYAALKDGKSISGVIVYYTREAENEIT